LIADVSGKSIGGAMLMSVCRSVVRAQAPGAMSPAELLRSVNRVISRDISEDMFITMVYIVLNTVTHKMTLARAGHEKPMLVRAGRPVEYLDSNGIAVGLADPKLFDELISEVSIDLQPDDMLIAYTDGITEAMNTTREEWGQKSFADTCVTSSPEGAHSLVNHVRQRIQRFVGEHPQYDDMTLLAMRIVRS
jgi:sigma-B regulation protein RsbU (phosphoserine phosphatase)